MPLVLKSVKSLRSSLCKVSLQPHCFLYYAASHSFVFIVDKQCPSKSLVLAYGLG